MLKRDGRLFLRGLIPALILTSLLALACGFAGVSAFQGSRQENAPVRVALVDNEDSVLSRISITMVTGQNYISSLLRIEQTDEIHAMNGLHEGQYSAAVILPDGYMDSIMHGKDCRGRICISDAIKNDGEVIAAIAGFGSRLLTAGQYGVFSGEALISSTGTDPEIYRQYLEGSNTGLIAFVLNAYDSLFTFEILDYSDTGVSIEMYYLICWFTLLLFVCGLFFPDLYIADCRGPVYARLQTVGIHRAAFLPGKLLYPFLFRCLLCLPLLYFTGIRGLVRLTAACFFTTCITTGIAVSLSKRGGWTVSILGVSLICLFLAGGMVPRTMLPAILPKIASLTPFGAVQGLLMEATGGNTGRLSPVLCIGYSVLFLGICLHFLKNPDPHSEEVRL